jgi:prepilin-type N-terminal cleavage/methylation domain-containing protein
MAAPLLDRPVAMTTRFRLDRGFTLPEIMLTVAVLAIIAGIGVPVMTDLTADIKVNEAARTVERELQDARLRAVSSNRILRVRMNCPAAGQLRTVEYLNSTAVDTATNRCDPTVYPYPAADNDVATRPNYDGTVRMLPPPASVGAHIIEFHPDGTAKNVVSNVGATITTPITITVTRKTRTRTITVNGAGKIQYQ